MKNVILLNLRPVSSSACAFTQLTHSPDSTTLSDLELLYPGSRRLYQQHMHDARFETALKRDPWFETQKLCLISVQNLAQYPHLSPENRINIIRTCLEGNFDRAQQIIPKADHKKLFSLLPKTFGFLLPASRRANVSLKEAMKILATRIPDSQFLLQITNMENCDEDTKALIQNVQGFAHTTLAALIVTTVEAMTHAILEMQLERRDRSIQKEIKSEESKVLRDVMVEFIQHINARSAERGDS